MTDRGILFSGPLVREILADRKTQTRRILRQMLCLNTGGPGRAALRAFDQSTGIATFGDSIPDDPCPIDVKCPYGVPGDRLWVRETFAELIAVSPASDQPIEITEGERLIEPPTSWSDSKGRTHWNYDGSVIAYRANSNIEFCDGDGFIGDSADRDDMPRWRPSIHMPRWASRITLEVTAVRVERLQDISEADAVAEGFHSWRRAADGHFYARCRTAVQQFAETWDRINGKRASWELNPYVWVVSFRRMKP